MVLIHGAGGMSLSWPAPIRRLEHTTVIAPDLPNHGKSAPRRLGGLEEFAAALLEWFDGMRLDPVDLCGHSMGGAIGLLLALQEPQRVRRLIVIGSAARLPVSPTLLELAADPRTFAQAVEWLIRHAFGPNAPQRTRELTAQRLLETPPQTLYSDLLACDRFDLSAEVARIRHPTLVIGGGCDRLVTPAATRWLATHLPCARLEVLPQAGHLVMLERPQEVARQISRFLRR